LLGVERSLKDLSTENFVAQRDIPLFERCIDSCSNKSVKVRILSERCTEGQVVKVQRDTRVTCSRFTQELLCCKFQLCEPSIEEKLEFYQTAEHFLEIPWGFFRVHQDEKDIFSLYESDNLQALRKERCGEQLKAYYCRSDGALQQEELDWWYERIARLSETNPTEVHIKETTVFGNTSVFQMKFYFVRRDENGHPIILAVKQDTTQTNQLQKHVDELDFTNKCLRHFFDLAPLQLGVVRLVKDHTDSQNVQFISTNRCQEDLVGVPLKGKFASEFTSPERVKTWIQQFNQARESKQAILFRDKYENAELGHFQHLHSCSVHVDGDVYAYMLQDVTENYRLEEELKKYQTELEEKIKERTRQLQEALHVKSRFLATMSHEMRTPLSGSMGAMALLEETPLNEDQKVCCLWMRFLVFESRSNRSSLWRAVAVCDK